MKLDYKKTIKLILPKKLREKIIEIKIKLKKKLARIVLNKPYFLKYFQHFLCCSDIAVFNTKEAYELIYSNKKYLNQYLNPSRISFYKEVANHCLQFIFQQKNKIKIIDVGCGIGEFFFYLKEYLKKRNLYFELYGIDITFSGIKKAKKKIPLAKFIVADAYKIPFKNDCFNLVLCLQTLEHLKNPQLVVEEMLRICAPSGKICITVPNGEKDKWEGHLNYWTKSQLISFLKPYGLEEVELIYDDLNLKALLEKR